MEPCGRRPGGGAAGGARVSRRARRRRPSRAASDAPPKRVAPADPAAQWTGAGGGHATFAYAANHLVDTDHGVIVDVAATRAIRQAETGAAQTMVDRTMDRFGLYPERLIADTAYGAAPMLNWLVEDRGIEPHIPVFDKSARRDGTFERGDFAYDHRSDTYTCPAGKILKPRRRNFAKPRDVVGQDDFIKYRASSLDCGACPLKPRCCPHTPERKVSRSSLTKAPATWLAPSRRPRPTRSRGA